MFIKLIWNKVLICGIAIPLALISGLLFPFPAWANDLGPDSLSVQHLSPAYRYPQAGWIVMHIEGEPYERGVQHGKLLASEIADYVQALAEFYEPKSPTAAWKLIRKLTNILFLNGFSPEQLEEMKGIADGASAVGATFDSRPIDLIDIIALNASNELDSLDSALEATPTGLESLHLTTSLELPKSANSGSRQQRPKWQHCSAFAAISPATKDGKIVFGHITMFDL